MLAILAVYAIQRAENSDPWYRTAGEFGVKYVASGGVGDDGIAGTLTITPRPIAPGTS